VDSGLAVDMQFAHGPSVRDELLAEIVVRRTIEKYAKPCSGRNREAEATT
jgi:hypothetical protein